MNARTVQPLAPVEYRALLTHCSTCDSCRKVPERECPRAGVLRRQWRAACRRSACARRPR